MTNHAGYAGTVLVPGAGTDPAELARRHGLAMSGARPGIAEYTRRLWSRRHFIVAFAQAKLSASYTTARLGQVWQLVTPLVNAGVYFLIFGVLLGTHHGVDNFIAYLCIGIFVFSFTQQAVQAGTRSIPDNLGLIRALHFPRASLPIAATLLQLQQLLMSMVVLVAIVLLTGEPVTMRWLLVVPSIALQTLFTAGLTMVVARLAARTTDLAQLMPFVLRTWMYGSGIFYSLDGVTAHAPSWVSALLQANPAAVYVNLMRSALIGYGPTSPWLWPLAVGWAVTVGVGGYLFFWRAEEEYGRG